MQGYTVMVDEALGQLGEPPTHVFVQGGVGGLAAAVAGHMADRFGATRPKLFVVEPEAANCLLRSAKAGRAIAMTPGAPTIIGMLECYRPSDVAWSILEHHADTFMDVIETRAPDVMKRLALPVAGDPASVAGESGGAGLAGALAAAAEPAKRAALGLDAQSRVLVFISEGATSPSMYRSIVGHSATNNAQ